MRVVSMVPAGTEIVAALGMTELLAAVSHDCDFPASIHGKPAITHCEIHGAGLPSAEVERWVETTLAERGTLYTIDEALLRSLAPDVILTQKLCDVCAPSHGSVAQLASTLEHPPTVVNLEPESLAGILANIETVASVLGDPGAGGRLVADLEARIAHVRSTIAARPLRHRPRTFLLEWIDPLYCSGHWGPELVEIAGGTEILGRAGEPSTRVSWEQVLAENPEVLVLSCCGNSVAQTLAELPGLAARPGWRELSAVQNDRVYVVDGSAFFSRPGPRIVDSLEILAGILHPNRFPEWISERVSPDEVQHVEVQHVEVSAEP